ncbi:MAG: glycosyltransferase family 2 protein [Clostridium sp.]|nr:glycosyltransferase family 2 protein [Clostridium sp.]
MKSHVKNKTDNKIMLSIGMIVKNEEKHLDKCLSALQKLRDNVSTELIIVDTGSTDRTKEIALKYTDMVYDFEWINDFSAARNYGLQYATGEWFMFIDADEYLDENCDEMIKFFNMPEVNSQYNSASFTMRNYGSKTKRASNQFLAPRIVRNFEGLKFTDPIHEWIPQPPPHGIFSTIFHHYGYVFESKKQKDIKSHRNMVPLLKEYEENPKDLRILYHICDAIYDDNYFKTPEEKEKYLDEYLSEAKKRIKEPYAFSAYVKYASYYITYNRHKEAVEILNEFVNDETFQKSILMVTAYYLLIHAHLNLEDDESACKEIEKYLMYYEKYQNNELDLVDMRFGVLQGVTEYDYEENVMHAARCLNRLERYDESIEYLDKVDISEMNFPHLKLYLNIMRDLVTKTKKYDYAVNCYEKILEFNDNDKTGLILFLLEQYYMENPKEREEFASEIVKIGKSGKYVELMRLVKDDNEGRDISDRLSGFLKSVDRWNDGYAEAIYLAMKNNVDVSEAIVKMSHNVLKDIIKIISDGHYLDYAQTTLDYCNNFDYGSSIRNMFWCVSALEAAVYKSNEINSEQKGELFDFFISILSDYVLNIYNPDLLNPDDAEILPEIHRFGYFITLAFTAKNNGDLIGYIRIMKDALRLCEPMKDLVSYYLNDLEAEMRKEN